jgi:hypothetical protein
VIANVAPGNLPLAPVCRVLDAYLEGPRRDWSRSMLTVVKRQRGEVEASQRQQEEARVVGTRSSLPMSATAVSMPAARTVR